MNRVGTDYFFPPLEFDNPRWVSYRLAEVLPLAPRRQAGSAGSTRRRRTPAPPVRPSSSGWSSATPAQSSRSLRRRRRISRTGAGTAAPIASSRRQPDVARLLRTRPSIRVDAQQRGRDGQREMGKAVTHVRQGAVGADHRAEALPGDASPLLRCRRTSGKLHSPPQMPGLRAAFPAAPRDRVAGSASPCISPAAAFRAAARAALQMRSSRQATQSSCSGQAAQSGRRLVQTAAPRSIRPWV